MISRRKFFKLTAAASAWVLASPAASAEEGKSLLSGGETYSHLSGTKLTAIPSICGECPSHCAILGYVDGGLVVKVEGQPQSIRNLGKVCAKGQASVAKIYDADRLLFPLKRTGKRGEGKWQRISWDEALDSLVARLNKLRDEGRAEQFVFHHGWIAASTEKLIDEIFLPSYGTASIINQTCHRQSARNTAHQLTWGGQRESWDFDNTRFVLNFGSSVMEASTNHVALARRLTQATVDQRIRLVTFDVRLSNTAAKSDQWIPLKPGTDLAVVLAMCNVVMNEDLYLGEGEAFLDFCLVNDERNTSTADKVEALKDHLAPYTPQWAEEISGVSAEEIASIAREFANVKPACVISSRGAVAHYNGVETERAIQMLAAITGNIDNPGGRCQGVTPDWIYPAGPKDRPEARKLAFIDVDNAKVALTEFGDGHGVLKRIKEGGERPGVYMWYHHNPAYASVNTQETIDILKDESLLPFTVAVTPYYDETAALADLILPDATYLEKFEIEEGVSPNQIPEYSLRQPLSPPQGEARDFNDVCCELAQRMGFPLGFKSGEKFVAAACKLTPLVKKKAMGFRGLKKKGVWHDKKAKPIYHGYRQQVPAETLALDGVILDESTGVYWNWKVAGITNEAEALETGYQLANGAYKGYVGQKIGDAVYNGFKPGVLNKSGYFELYSPVLAMRGGPSLPGYVAIPEHSEIKDGQLILTTFKVNVQAVSNSGNAGWLSEIYHNNPVWINPLTATARGITDGDNISIKSRIGEAQATVKVTPAVAPGVLALSTHVGRWQGGRYSSGKRAPFGINDTRHAAFMWWEAGGTHPNWIIPDSPEPISGQQRWMDTIVTITRV